MTDIIIVGGGAAGMTAALYAVRNGKSALVIEKNSFGGQITHSPRVENFPGTLSMSGNEFADSLMSQILEQGAEIELETVTSVVDHGDYKTVFTEEGNSFDCKTVILATGVKHRPLGLQGENDFVGDGISYCAVCDGDFYKNQRVCVAGGGNSALQEALLLSEKCSQVTILQDLPYLTGEETLCELLKRRDNVEILTSVKINGIISEGNDFKGLNISLEGKPTEIKCEGLFVAIGLIPKNDAFKSLADLNEFGYFDSSENCLTKTKGIFVAGDCRSKSVRQLTTAAADGSTAALAACAYIDRM